MDEFIEMRVMVRASQIPSVYAVLAGSTAIVEKKATPIMASASTGDVASDPAPMEAPAPVETPEGVDAHGHAWDASLHASTGSKTKEGLWRMNKGVTRPAPLEGYPKEDIGTTEQVQEDSPQENSATEPTVTETESVPEVTTEEDEFAAFTAAAQEVEAPSEVKIPERVWTDADLGVLCNKAAVKMGNPSQIKEVIAKYIPEGVVSHSRNIAETDRAAFAAEIEELAGVKFDS
jgi:hypothetical protein